MLVRSMPEVLVRGGLALELVAAGSQFRDASTSVEGRSAGVACAASCSLVDRRRSEAESRRMEAAGAGEDNGSRARGDLDEEYPSSGEGTAEGAGAMTSERKAAPSRSPNDRLASSSVSSDTFSSSFFPSSSDLPGLVPPTEADAELAAPGLSIREAFFGDSSSSPSPPPNDPKSSPPAPKGSVDDFVAGGGGTLAERIRSSCCDSEGRSEEVMARRGPGGEVEGDRRKEEEVVPSRRSPSAPTRPCRPSRERGDSKSVELARSSSQA